MKRVFLIVLDSCGIGAMPDCREFGDENCNTLKRISESQKFSAENLIELGLGNIDSIDYLDKNDNPLAAVARLTEKSKGKDTTIGHWEIAGIVSNNPLPTYPNGFPQSVIDEFSQKTGRKIICNKPYSGTDVIRDYGQEHVETGALIVYTSADSVLQIAAHENVVPIETLYEYCRIARKILSGENAVGRVIARPFEGEYPNFRRTANRHDFSLSPPKGTLLDALIENGKTVYAVGKIYDIFAGKGISEHVFTHSNEEG
ncbi:MAG: phosphopentomutase, partial [Acutalibacteraceae bacterium]|nr:phosphopentomutase [Acutalibacteraceae bacterium]